ncbi:sigma-70 family RNA polymerase sigma factor [Kribbella pittospori]|uniref:Sigma-70 family RNA polymerase sigma factor n=1 Tax=Kribbella pittospori TaxID=722689 RepID=A0A4R0JUX8_9ACTN|nr:sigma-70 family RNA polymerase sigma factor [Kribbella pittospori]TCC50377.1 sigma-70 family RNA polymerase sigma factor [Kribbella pittospori]
MPLTSLSPAPTTSLRHADTLEEQAAEVEHLLRTAAQEQGFRREELLSRAIVAGVPLARRLASRYRRRGVDAEDLDQIASEHLVKAAYSYQPSKGSDFRSYAIPTIRGGIRHHFRDRAWTVKPPRRIQDLQSRINDAEASLAIELQRWPRIDEIATAIGVDAAEIAEAERARGCFQPSSLDAPLPHSSVLTRGHLMATDSSDAFELVDQIESLRPVVEGLPPRDRLILRRRFVEQRSQSDIGAEIGVSQMQVSRLLNKILYKLRGALST